METAAMGRVTTEAILENLQDLWAVESGMISRAQARRAIVTDAQADSRVTLLSLPTRLIAQLGLEKTGSKRVRSSSGGLCEAALYEAVRLTIQERSCTMDVLEVPDDVPVLIGQIPLEHLDFVIDLRSRSLVGNPAHDGEHIYELY